MLRTALSSTVRAPVVQTTAYRGVATTTASTTQKVSTTAVVGVAATVAAGTALWLGSGDAHASGALEPARYAWPHYGATNTYDHRAIRRGFQVYRQVCSSCHGVERIAYRNLVGVAYTEEEMKEIAAEATVTDGPDDEGNMFERPGKLADYIHSPYANEGKARKANNGALPKDLSCVVKGRHDHEDYIFSVLTGYKDPPAGIEVADPLHYNPYFPGSKIAMAQSLFDGAVEYDDGTPATATQMAKDVSVFLAWASEPEQDERKRIGIKAVTTLSILTLTLLYWKRMKWAPYKTRQLLYKKM